MRRIAAILIAIALLPGCNQPSATSDSAQNGESRAQSQSRSSAISNERLQSELTDESGATRVVTLAPHLAEFVFAVGAGDRLVGVSAYSDFPPEVIQVPVVSDAFTVDQEQLALLEPDLILAWQSGTPVALIDQLRNAGYNVVAIETRGLEDIADAIVDVADSVGALDYGTTIAGKFVQSLNAIADDQAGKSGISVFYQVSSRPLYTVSSAHYISEIIALCGGRNIFEDLGELAPAVTVEAVVDRDPEVLLAGSNDGSLPFEDWSRWNAMAANRYSNHFVVSADAIGRPSLRLVDAAKQVCAALDESRNRRVEANNG